jgi:hypothetical protein
MKKCEGIYDKLLQIYKVADEKDITTVDAADHMVEERIEMMKAIHNIRG